MVRTVRGSILVILIVVASLCVWLGPQSARAVDLETSLCASRDLPGYATGLDVAGDYVFVTDVQYGLSIFDVSNPADPVVVGSCLTWGSAMSVEVRDDLAYVADGFLGLAVVDVSDVTAPSLAGVWFLNGMGVLAGVATGEDFVYGSGGYFPGLGVFDVSNLSGIKLLGYLNLSGSGASSLSLIGDYALVADGALRVVDVSVPESPVLVSMCSTGGADDVVAVGNHAYVAAHYSGLQIVDVSDLTSPTLEGGLALPGLAERLCVSGDYALVACANGGLQIVDISDEEELDIAGYYQTAEGAVDVIAVGEYIYVATGTSLLVLETKISCCQGIRGNVDGDIEHSVELVDLQYLVAYLRKDGPVPPCLKEADVNGDGEINQEDVSCLARYLFSSGNPCQPASCP